MVLAFHPTNRSLSPATSIQGAKQIFRRFFLIFLILKIRTAAATRGVNIRLLTIILGHDTPPGACLRANSRCLLFALERP